MNPHGTSTVGPGSPCPGPFCCPEAFFKPVLILEGAEGELGALCLSYRLWLWHKGEPCLSAQARQPSFLQAVAPKTVAKNVQMQNPTPFRQIPLIIHSTL